MLPAKYGQKRRAQNLACKYMAVIAVVATIAMLEGGGLKHRRLLRVGRRSFQSSDARRLRDQDESVSRGSRSLPEMDVASDNDDKGEMKQRGTDALPQCYSSPSADPSTGVWRKCEDGVRESPVDMVNWNFSEKEFGREPGCLHKWEKEHMEEDPMPYYTWEPNRCLLDTVDEAKFCRVMEGRKGLLFVGDSLTRLMSTTLASILRADTVVAGADNRCHDEWLACNGALNVTFQRNDFLDTRTDRGFNGMHCEVPDMSSTRCTIFADNDTLSRFDTLVVNSGAHPRPAARYGPAMEVASKTIASSMKTLHGGDAVLVVRNTVPGHWDCNKRMFEGPVDLDVALGLVAASPKKYNWTTFQDNNALLEAAFGNVDGWRLLDAYAPTIFRADSHKGGTDCLHYCVPGPVDHWVRLLYNILVVATGADRPRS